MKCHNFANMPQLSIRYKLKGMVQKIKAGCVDGSSIEQFEYYAEQLIKEKRSMYADNDRLYELKPEKIIIPLAAPTVVITGK